MDEANGATRHHCTVAPLGCVCCACPVLHEWAEELCSACAVPSVPMAENLIISCQDRPTRALLLLFLLLDLAERNEGVRKTAVSYVLVESTIDSSVRLQLIGPLTPHQSRALPSLTIHKGANTHRHHAHAHPSRQPWRFVFASSSVTRFEAQPPPPPAPQLGVTALRQAFFFKAWRSGRICK